MRSLDKRGVGLESETLVKIILLLVALLVIAGVINVFYKPLTVHNLKVFGCTMANGVMSSNALFRCNMQIPCKQDLIRDPMSKEDFAIYLTDVWLMYGKGEWNFHCGSDDYTLVSALMLNQDLKIKDLFSYLLTHSGKRDLSEGGAISWDKISKSDYNYLQSGSPGQTICLHKSLLPGEGKVATMRKNKVYYIFHWDDTDSLVPFANDPTSGDKIIISTASKLKGGYAVGSGTTLSDIVCCTLKQGKCLQLAGGGSWKDYHMVIGNWLTGEGWKPPGEHKETSGALFD